MTKRRSPKSRRKTPAKSSCWEQFSRFIRLRDCLKTTGTITHGLCVSCSRKYPFTKLQAGHFMPGRSDTVLLDERGVNAQCYRCNIETQGNWPGYYRAMQRMHGQETIEAMIDEWERNDVHYTADQLSGLELFYKMEVEKILKKHEG